MRSTSNITYIDSGDRKVFSLKELWLFRELAIFFVWRDIKVRYKQTAIGAGWAIIQPFLATGVFTIFFNKVAGIQSGDQSVPYVIFAYLGLMYWNCYSSAMNTISNSLVASQGIITKIYFPRLLPPLTSGMVSVIDFFAAGSIFLLILGYYSFRPQLLGIILFVPMLLLVSLTAFAVGNFFAALNVRYRDVRAALPFITQITMFLTPVIYPLSLVPQKYQWLIYFNPVAGAISTIRASLLGIGEVNWAGLGVSVFSLCIMMFVSLMYFSKVEKNFADII